MKRFVLLIVVMVCFSLTAFAADVPAFEAFGGFALIHQGSAGSYKPKGWLGSGEYNFHKTVGLVGEFGGQYKKHAKTYEFMVGPRFNFREDGFNFFIDAFAGGIDFTPPTVTVATPSLTKFGMAYGGGLDVPAGKVTIRVFQFDWLPYRTGGTSSTWVTSNTRWAFGVVFPFGKMK